MLMYLLKVTDNRYNQVGSSFNSSKSDQNRFCQNFRDHDLLYSLLFRPAFSSWSLYSQHFDFYQFNDLI